MVWHNEALYDGIPPVSEHGGSMNDALDFEATVRASSFVGQLQSDAKESIIRELIDALDRDGRLPDRLPFINRIERVKYIADRIEAHDLGAF